MRTILPEPSTTSASAAAVDRCADRILEAIPRIMHRIRHEMRAQASPRLTVPQMRALLFVQRRPDANLTALAEHLGASPSTCSALVERLVRHGLIERTADPDERRRIRLRATSEGAAVVTQARAETRKWLRRTLDPLSPVELGDLMRAIDLLESVTTEAPGREERA